jgi:hypothetical protein
MVMLQSSGGRSWLSTDERVELRNDPGTVRTYGLFIAG